MNKILLVLLLFAINIYANKNWIEFDKNSTNNSNKKVADLKMYNPKSTLKSSDDSKISNNTQNSTNPDKDLIDTIREFNNMAKKVHSKIKQ